MQCKQVKAQKAYIKDMELILDDATSNSSANSTNDLKRKIEDQLPGMKQKYINEIHKHYNAGTWVSKQTPVPSASKSLYKSYKNISNTTSKQSLRELPGILRDEVPIKPMNTGYEEVALEVNEELPPVDEPPKKKFTNFLKRNTTQKYDPRQSAKQNKYDPKKLKNLKSSINNDQRQQPEEAQDIEQEETQYKFDFNQTLSRTPTKTPELTRTPTKTPELTESDYTAEDMSETNRPIRSFLKRKSQAVKTQKLNWNVTSRINCWTSKDSPRDLTPVKEKPIEKPAAPKKKAQNGSKKQLNNTKRIILPPPQKVDKLELSRSLYNNIAQSTNFQDPPSSGEMFSVDDLESIFSDMCKRHISAYAYFKTIKRFDSRTKIPQFRPYSTFIKHYLHNS